MNTDTLLDVIDRLTIEHPYRALIDGKTRWVRRDPLIAQLREAVASSLVGGAGPGTTSSRIPFDADAMEQYDRLEQLILDSLRGMDSDRVPGLTPEENLRAWFVLFNDRADTDEIEAARREWARWEAIITAKLHPPIVLELIDMHTRRPFDCPECGGPSSSIEVPTGWYQVVLNSGPDGKGGRWYEKEQRVKLTAMYRPDGAGGLDCSAVECGCCGWRVTGNAIRGFAWELEGQEAS